MASMVVPSPKRVIRQYRNSTSLAFDAVTSRAQQLSAVPTSPSGSRMASSIQSEFPSNSTIFPIIPDQRTNRPPVQSAISPVTSAPTAVTASGSIRRSIITFTTTVTLPLPLPTETSIANGGTRTSPTSAPPISSATADLSSFTISIRSRPPMRPSDRTSLDWSAVLPTTTVSSSGSQLTESPTAVPTPETTALFGGAETNRGNASEPGSANTPRVSAPAVAGGVLGGFVGLAILGAIVFLCCRRRHPRRDFAAWKRRMTGKWRTDDESVSSAEARPLMSRARDFAQNCLPVTALAARIKRRRESHHSRHASAHSSRFILPEVTQVSRCPTGFYVFDDPFRDPETSAGPAPLRCTNPDPSAPSTPSATPTPAGSINSARPSFGRKISGLPIFAAMTSRNVRTPPGSLFDRSGRPSTSGTGRSSPAPLGQQYSRGSPKSSSSNLAPAPRFLAPPPFTFLTAGPPRNPSTQDTNTPIHGTTPGLTDRPNPLEIQVQNLSSDSTFTSSAPTPSNNLPAQPKNIYLVPPSSTSPPSGPTSASLSLLLDARPEVLGYGKGGNAGAGAPARTSIQEEAVSPRDWAVNF